MIEINVLVFTVQVGPSLLFHQGDGEITGIPESGDSFRYSLASGDIGGFQQEQLIIGAPFEDVQGSVAKGSIHTLDLTDCELGEKLVLGSSDLGGPDVASRWFGFAAHAAGLDGDRKEEMIIGAPGEQNPNGRGTLWVVYLGPDGLSEHRERLAPAGATRFGNSIAAGQFFTRESPLALAVGDPFMHVPDEQGPNTGAVMLIPNLEIFSNGFEGFNTAAWTLTVP